MVSSEEINPRFPLYIPSKGRWESRLTVKTLESMSVPYHIVIEEQEYENFAAVINKDKILVLDKQYQRDYDTCDDLGDSKSKGPGPARNFIWEHAEKSGFAWHWVMDDNIKGFYRWNNSNKTQIKSGNIFRWMEDFVLRYKNVAMAGPNYSMFLPARNNDRPPFHINTRIYSCNLIRNDAPFRWRGRYNEDTILSLDMLKAGYCTILFNAFQQEKVRTQTLKGGNTAEFYSKEGTLPKSQMQVEQHPDCSRLVWKYGRWHHHVDYKRFKQKLIRRDDIEIPQGVNNYGMKLVKTGKTAELIKE